MSPAERVKVNHSRCCAIREVLWNWNRRPRNIRKKLKIRDGYVIAAKLKYEQVKQYWWVYCKQYFYTHFNFAWNRFICPSDDQYCNQIFHITPNTGYCTLPKRKPIIHIQKFVGNSLRTCRTVYLKYESGVDQSDFCETSDEYTKTKYCIIGPNLLF